MYCKIRRKCQIAVLGNVYFVQAVLECSPIWAKRSGQGRSALAQLCRYRDAILALAVPSQARHLAVIEACPFRASAEIVSYAVESLSNVIGGDSEDEETEYSEAEAQDLGERFTEIFIKKRENIGLVLSLIEVVRMIFFFPYDQTDFCGPFFRTTSFRCAYTLFDC